MTAYEFGDVVLVPFPFSNQTFSKKRPAVVISSSVYNRVQPDLIILAITSQQASMGVFGEAVVSHWKDAGLLKPSVFKPVITTIEKSLIIHKLGKLVAHDQKSLSKLIKSLIGDQ